MLVASKHMSMWDTLALYLVLDDPAIVLKRELLRIPFYGWYLWKAAAIAIDRGAGAEALRRMIHAAEKVLARGPPDPDFSRRHAQKAGRAARLQARRGGLYANWKLPACRWRWIPGAIWRASGNSPAPSPWNFWTPFPPG